MIGEKNWVCLVSFIEVHLHKKCPGEPFLVRANDNGYAEDVLWCVAVDAFGFHLYSLVHIDEHWWKRTQLSYVFIWKGSCYGLLPYNRYIAYTSCASSPHSYIVQYRWKRSHSFTA
uniref:SFRICE_024985 n=1 Tax=Spodoptera frugiperda TaxID=7108 RepID=A0A2H1X264_SPOFR